MPLTINTPLSIYSIPIVWFAGFYPHNRRFALISRTVGWDNLNPRGHDKDVLVKKGMSPELAQRAQNLASAHQNGFEAFNLWAAAVLAANIAGVDHSTLNICSGAFIGLRLLYNYIYINQKTKSSSNLRTLTWVASVVIPLFLLVNAGNKSRVGGF